MIYVIAEWPRKLYNSLLVYVFHLPNSTMEMDDWGGNMIYHIFLFWDMDCKRWFISSRNRVYFSSEQGGGKGGCVRNVHVTFTDIFGLQHNRKRVGEKGYAYFPCTPKVTARCICSLNCFIKLLHECTISAARHLTFILMMSVTQPTCDSLFSQQKCLGRGKLHQSLIYTSLFSHSF